MADLQVLMMRQAGNRRLLLAVASSLAVAVLTFHPPARAQETRLSAPAPSTPATSPSTQPSDVPPNPLGEAKALLQKGDFDGASKKYQQILQEKPKSPDAYAGLTRCYLKKKDVAQAYETVSKGLQVADSWPVRVALGEVYFRQGKIPEAETEWVNVINSGHQAARAYFGLARVRRAIAMNKSAKAMIDKAHELDPSDLDIEKRWVETVPRSERIKYYEKYLAEPNALDADERRNLGSYLSYLKERAKQNDRPCRLISKVKNTETPLVRMLIDPRHLLGYGLAVELNGTKSRLLLDTGASGILVKRHTAEQAGITKLTETKIRGIGDKGLKDAFVGIANSIRIGELEFQNCPVGVMESRSVVGEDGLIGADVFEDFLVDIDFPDEKLKLSELPKRPGEAERQIALKNQEDEFDEPENADTREAPGQTDAKETAPRLKWSGPQDRYIAPEMQSYTRVYRLGHILVPTKVGDVPGKLFMLDSGAVDNAISPAAAREVTKVQAESHVRVGGISGSLNRVYSAEKAVLEFGHLRQENQEMIAFDTTSISENAGTEVSGFLGFTMLRFIELKIDYRDALVDFNYDPKRFAHF